MSTKTLATESRATEWNYAKAYRYICKRLNPYVKLADGSIGMLYDPWEIVNRGWVKWLALNSKSPMLYYRIGTCLVYAFKDYWREERRQTNARHMSRLQLRAQQEHIERYEVLSLGKALRDCTQLTRVQKQSLTLLEMGYSPVEIAKMLNVSKPRISAIIRRIRELAQLLGEGPENRYPLPLYRGKTNTPDKDYASDKAMPLTTPKQLPQAYRVHSRNAWKVSYRAKRIALKLAAMCEARYGKSRGSEPETIEPRTNCPLHIVHKVPQEI